MLSGSASFQMHPRNPFRNLLELFLETLLLASSCSQPLPSSSTSPPSPSPYPSPFPLLLAPPLFSYSSPFSSPSPLLLPLPPSKWCLPVLQTTTALLISQDPYDKFIRLMGGHYLFLSVRKKQAQLWTKSMGVKKKRLAFPQWPSLTMRLEHSAHKFSL